MKYSDYKKGGHAKIFIVLIIVFFIFFSLSSGYSHSIKPNYNSQSNSSLNDTKKLQYDIDDNNSNIDGISNEFENQNNSKLENNNTKTKINDNIVNDSTSKNYNINNAPSNTKTLNNTTYKSPSKTVSNNASNGTPNNLNNSKLKNINNLSIGGISILGDCSNMNRIYGQYLTKYSNSNTLFYNGGSGQYGDFLLVADVNSGIIHRITYTQYNISNPILTMNLNNVKINDDQQILVETFGKWDNEEINHDVKKLFYDNYSFKNTPINLIIYVNSHTNKIYGYEISIK